MIIPIHSRSSKLTLSIIYTLYDAYYCAALKFNLPFIHFNNLLRPVPAPPWLPSICMRI